MEGKEVRFGIVPSSLFAISTTSVSCGAVNSMLDSYMPMSGMCALFMILTGEVVFGGVGSGLSGMLIFVILAIFIAGLMIGKMPEYLGKKIGTPEMRLCTAMILAPIGFILLGTALALNTDAGRSGILNPGAHGLTEVLYAFASATQNNGSAFAGLDASTDFYNWALGICMLFGRFLIIGLTMALSGVLVMKNITPKGSGTLPTHNSLFIIWLSIVVLLFGALSYLAVLLIGPIVEFLLL
jgi:K+-transporting ATPase ATPase A chain